jgi:hypothetical protein
VSGPIDGDGSGPLLRQMLVVKLPGMDVDPVAVLVPGGGRSG